MRASTKLCRISAFVDSDVNVDGRKLGNFWNEKWREPYLEDERQRELGEGNNREHGEGDESTGVDDRARQKLALPIAQLSALDQLPEESAARVQLASVQLRARPDVRRARPQRSQRLSRATVRLPFSSLADLPPRGLSPSLSRSTLCSPRRAGVRRGGNTYAGRIHDAHAFAAGGYQVEHALLALEMRRIGFTYWKQVQGVWNLFLLPMQLHCQAYAQAHGIQHPEIVAD